MVTDMGNATNLVPQNLADRIIETSAAIAIGGVNTKELLRGLRQVIQQFEDTAQRRLRPDRNPNYFANYEGVNAYNDSGRVEEITKIADSLNEKRILHAARLEALSKLLSLAGLTHAQSFELFGAQIQAKVLHYKNVSGIEYSMTPPTSGGDCP
jgi:hypothetical protein